MITSGGRLRSCIRKKRYATGLPSGTVYPILRRLDAEGCVRSKWEKEGVARREQRPPRRYYELTGAGKRLLRPVESEG